MNERHLYRGKRLRDGEWIVGYRSVDADGEPSIDTMYEDTGGFKISFCVDPITLGQCTGIRDKHGALIYEGDVLEEFNEDGLIVNPRVKVLFGPYQHLDAQREYANGDVGFYCEAICERHNIYRPDLQFWAAMGRVIGNIYDKPELLVMEGEHISGNPPAPASTMSSTMTAKEQFDAFWGSLAAITKKRAVPHG